jgi:hypothetical protein
MILPHPGYKGKVAVRNVELVFSLKPQVIADLVRSETVRCGRYVIFISGHRRGRNKAGRGFHRIVPSCLARARVSLAN